MEKRYIGGAGLFLAAILLIFQETIRFVYQQLLSWIYATFGGDKMSISPVLFDPIFIIALLLTVFGLVTIFWNPILGLVRWNKKHTTVQISVLYPGMPTEVRSSNLWRWSWFWLETPGIETTSIFVWVFDGPIDYHRVRVTGHNIQLPGYEVKTMTRRHCIISFVGKVPDGVIEFELITK